MVIADEENDQDDPEDRYDEEDLPKSEQLNPCTAPSSESCDNPQLRVGFDPWSSPQQESTSPPPEMFLLITYDSAKYSTYYNISAVSLDAEEDEEHDERDPAADKVEVYGVEVDACARII